MALLLVGSLISTGEAPQGQTSIGNYVEKARTYLSGAYYDVRRAASLLERTSVEDPASKDALFTLARIYYITGDTDKSLAAIAQYKELFPDEKRIYYVSGLANAYAGNLRAAEEEFKTFIASGLSRWPGYLDLAWVYFKQGNLNDAADTLDSAIARFGDNAWLNTSRGAVALAQEDRDEALAYLLRAREQVEKLTEDEWRANYSLNDPNRAREGIEKLRTVIETNIAYAQGDTLPADAADALSASFASASPLGVAKGLAVSACGDSCGTESCISAANICGDVNVGTRSTCSESSNTCSASVPPNPSGTCSVATECGVNATGYIGCNGQCNITRYPFCKTVNNTIDESNIEWITVGNVGSGGGEVGVTDITCDIVASPTLVVPNGRTVIRWLSTETVSGAITSSSNGDNWSGLRGEEVTSELTEETTYTLTCEGYDGTVITDSVTVDIVPQWQEF